MGQFTAGSTVAGYLVWHAGNDAHLASLINISSTTLELQHRDGTVLDSVDLVAVGEGHPDITPGNSISALTGGDVVSQLTVDADGHTTLTDTRTLTYGNVGAAPAAGNSNIATVGTIAAGTWQGTAIAAGYMASHPPASHTHPYVGTGARLTGNASAITTTSVRLWDVSTATDDPTGAEDGILSTGMWDSTDYGVQSYHDLHTNTLSLRRKHSSTWHAWDKVWTSGNDGSGSGLDADLWDGNQFASYLNQALLTSSSPTFANLTLGAVTATGDLLTGTYNTTAQLYVRGGTNTFAVPSFQVSNLNNDTPIVAKFYGNSTLNDNYLVLSGRGDDATVLGQNGRATALPIEGYLGTLLADGVTLQKSLKWDVTGLLTTYNGLAVTGSLSVAQGTTLTKVHGSSWALDVVNPSADYQGMRIRHTSTSGSGGPGGFGNSALVIQDERNNNLTLPNPVLYINRSGANTKGDLFHIRNHSTYAFVVDEDSNVGIGTDAPDFNNFGAGHGILGIHSTATPSTAMLNLEGNSNNTINQRIGSLFFNDSSNSGGGGTVAGIEAYSNSADALDGGAYIKFSTNITGGSYTEKMRLTADGSVGIGTTDPTEKLEVNGSIMAGSPASAYAKLSSGGDPSLILHSSGNAGEGADIYYDSSQEDLYIGTRYATNSFIAFKTGYQDNNIVTNGTEHLRIRQDGFVGIGTTSPLGKLHVSDSTAYNGAETASGQDSIMLYGGNTSAAGTYNGGITWISGSRRRAGISSVKEAADADQVGLAFWTKGTDGPGNMYESMRIDHSGNVGIGTTNPSAALHTVGLNTVVGTKLFGGGNSGVDILQVGATDGSPLMVMDDNSNVGIGTASPGSKLHIVQDGNARALNISSDATDFETLYATGKYAGFFIQDVVDGRGLYVRRNNNGAETYPLVALVADHAGDTQTTLDIQNDGTGAGLVVDGTGTGYSAIFNNGYVGIGTTSPGANLEIQFSDSTATPTNAFRIHNTYNGVTPGYGSSIEFGFSSDFQDYKKAEIRAIAATGYANAIDLSFWAGGSSAPLHTEKMRITSAGNVGIGTTSPSYQLDVNGTGRFVGALTGDSTITWSGGGSANANTAYGWGDHGTQSYATQSYVGTQISNLVDSSPATLDTLNELAAALGDDPNFATTVTNNIATKLPLAGGTLTGDIQMNKAIHFETNSSGNAAHSYAIFQEAGSWTYPYPDLRIAYHTGIKLGAHSNYNGTRFYNNSDMATEIFSVGNGDNHVRVAYNLYIIGSVTASNLSGTNTGDQTVAYTTAIAEGNSGLVPSAGAQGTFLKANATWDTPTYTTTLTRGDITGTGVLAAGDGITGGNYDGSTSPAAWALDFGTSVTQAAQGNHTHGNLGNSGKIGSVANLPLITTTEGTVTVGAFGTGSTNVCVGDDSRLSDARAPTTHSHSQLAGSVEGNDIVYVAYPAGASYYGGNTTTNSAIKILFPDIIATDNAMLKIRVEIIDSANKESSTVILSGFYSGDGGTWYSESAQIIASSTAKDYDISFGQATSGEAAIWIGDTTSDWSFLTVIVTEFMAGYPGVFDSWEISDFDNGWDIQVDTAIEDAEVVLTGNLPAVHGHQTLSWDFPGSWSGTVYTLPKYVEFENDHPVLTELSGITTTGTFTVQVQDSATIGGTYASCGDTLDITSSGVTDDKSGTAGADVSTNYRWVRLKLTSATFVEGTVSAHFRS